MPSLRKRILAWLGAADFDEVIDAIHRLEAERNDEMTELRRRLALATTVGMDLRFSRPGGSTVVVLSRLNGGRVEIRDVAFRDARDIDEFLRDVEARYEPDYREMPPYVDGPPGFADRLRKGRW